MILPAPNAKAKPQAQYPRDAIERLVRILATTVPAFLAREKPISRKANPACMKKTRSAARTTHTVSIAALVLRVPGWGVAFAMAGKANRKNTERGSARLRMARIVVGHAGVVFVRVSEVRGEACAELSPARPSGQSAPCGLGPMANEPRQGRSRTASAPSRGRARGCSPANTSRTILSTWT